MTTEITTKHVQAAAIDILHHVDGCAENFAFAILKYVGKEAILEALDDTFEELGWDLIDVKSYSDEEWKRILSDWGAGL